MAPNPTLQRLHEAGVSIWLDTLSRQLLEGGEFKALIGDYAVTGATSNPTIFAKAITTSDLYDDQLRRLLSAGQRDLQELFFSLALDMCEKQPGCSARNTTAPGVPTVSSPSSARRTWPTTPRRRSHRRGISGSGSINRT